MTAGQSTIITAFIYILGNTRELCFNDKIQFCHHTQLLITNQVKLATFQFGTQKEDQWHQGRGERVTALLTPFMWLWQQVPSHVKLPVFQSSLTHFIHSNKCLSTSRQSLLTALHSD